MLKLLKSIKTFSRKVQKDIDPQIMKDIQFSIVEKCEKKNYKIPQEFKHEDILYEEELYGNKCQISGITQNNQKSAEFTKQVIQSSKPNLVILGGLNDTQAMAILNESINSFSTIQNLKPSKLFCKTTLLPMIQKRIQSDKHYFYDQTSRIIWQTDHLNRSFYINDYINAAYQSMLLDYKLIYGKPSSVYIYQDLILTLSLNQLKEIFENIVTKAKQRHPSNINETSVVLMEQIKTYGMYEQPRLYSKEITYTTALLNRLTKIQTKNVLLIPTCFVKRIADQVHKIDFQPESIYRKGLDDYNSENYDRLNEILTNKKREEVLQKFAILSILKGMHLQLHLVQGRNFFKHSIFNDLLGQYSPEQIITMYRPFKHKYMQKLFDIIRNRIKNKLSDHPPQTQFMYLKDQFKTLQTRQKIFLYQYEPKNYLTQIQNSQKLQNLNKKLLEIVELECDDYQKRLFQQYKKGNTTKENIILYSKLIGKANVELKEKVKLPYYHYNAFRGFYKQYLRQNLLFDQDKKQRRLQMKKVAKLSQNFDKISKQIKNPEQLRQYLSGEKGKVKKINMYQDNNTGELDMDGQIQDLQQVISQLGNEQMKKDFQQFRKKYPREDEQDFSEQDENDFGQKEEDQDKDFIHYEKQQREQLKVKRNLEKQRKMEEDFMKNNKSSKGRKGIKRKN